MKGFESQPEQSGKKLEKREKAEEGESAFDPEKKAAELRRRHKKLKEKYENTSERWDNTEEGKQYMIEVNKFRIKKADHELPVLQEDLEYRKSLLNNAQNRRQEAQERLTKLQRKLESARGELKNQSGSTEELQQKIIEERQKEVDKVRDDVQQWRRKEKLHRKKIEEIEKEINNLKEKQNQAQKKIDELKGIPDVEIQVEDNQDTIEQAKKILDTPVEELRNIPDKRLLDLIDNLNWNRWEGEEQKTAPEVVMDAEARIYQCYEPSEILHQNHEEAIDAIFDSDAEALEMKRKWKNAGKQGKIDVCKHIIDRMASSYQIDEPIWLSTNEEKTATGDHSEARFIRTNNEGGFGYVNVSPRNLDMPLETVVRLIAHEMSHGYQEWLEELSEENRQEAIGDANDVDWFQAPDRVGSGRDLGYSFKDSHKRYLSLPKEQDAYSMQEIAETKAENRIASAENKIMESENLPAVDRVVKNARFARWAEKMLSNEEVKTGDDLIAKAKEDLTESGVQKARSLFAGLSEGEVNDFAQKAKDQKRRAEEVLGYGL